MTFFEQLFRLNACSKARKWVGSRTLEEAWAECHRGDWMIWLSMRMAGSSGWSPSREVIDVLCDIVEPTLQRVPAGETRPAYAVATVRRWCAGEAASSELRAAAEDASGYAVAAAAAAAAAADDAAAAATKAAAAEAADAFAAAADAAFAAADAAANAAFADADAAEAATLAQQAELIKSRLTTGGVDGISE